MRYTNIGVLILGEIKQLKYVKVWNYLFLMQTDIKGNPIEGAAITLYGYEQITNKNGCFHFDVADALPFTLSVNIKGYKALEVPANAGYFEIKINLAPSGSEKSSEITWKEINSDRYKNIKKCT